DPLLLVGAPCQLRRASSKDPLLLEAAVCLSDDAETLAHQPGDSTCRDLSRSSPGSSCASLKSLLPAASRLVELVEEKSLEVYELRATSERTPVGSEEWLQATTLLAAAREELRLLREYAGLSENISRDLPSVDSGSAAAAERCRAMGDAAGSSAAGDEGAVGAAPVRPVRSPAPAPRRMG
ncbi:unnamed protein product, partial [Polarella glacialis]